MGTQQGISLLELVLGIALITAILVGSMRYFQVARQSGRINESLLMIKAVYGAAETWRAKGLNFSDPSGSPEGTEGDPLLKKFVHLGLLPSSYETQHLHNPWGGELKVEGEGRLFRMMLTQIPQKACEAVKGKLEWGMMADAAVKELACTGEESAVTLNVAMDIP